MAASNDEEMMDAGRSRDGRRVRGDRPTYDEKHFEESFPPLEHQRLQVFISEIFTVMLLQRVLGY